MHSFSARWRTPFARNIIFGQRESTENAHRHVRRYSLSNGQFLRALAWIVRRSPIAIACVSAHTFCACVRTLVRAYSIQLFSITRAQCAGLQCAFVHTDRSASSALRCVAAAAAAVRCVERVRVQGCPFIRLRRSPTGASHIQLVCSHCSRISIG